MLKKIISLGIICYSLSSSAIIIRHDKADTEYQELAQRFIASMAYLDMCAGTVIGKQWVITANHCVNAKEQYPLHITHLNKKYFVDKIIGYPEPGNTGEHDIALLHISYPLKNAEPVSLYSEDDELGQMITIVGQGLYGNGLLGEIGLDKRTRAANNRISSVDSDWINFIFNRADKATELEGVAGSQDSGGPAFIEQQGKRYVAGVSCCQESDKFAGEYLSKEYYVRISTHISWIKKEIEQYKSVGAYSNHPIINAIANSEQKLLNQLIIKQDDWKTNAHLLNQIMYLLMLNDDHKTFELIIEQDRTAIQKTLHGLPLLDFAMKQGNSKIFRSLIKLGADIHHKGFKGQEYLSRLMWQYHNDDAIDLAELLIKKGLRVSHQDQRGDSAIHMAGYKGSVSRVKGLLILGADINAIDNKGQTILMDASRRGNLKLVDFLLRNNADLTLRDESGKSALDIAREYENTKIVDRINKEHLKLDCF
jgi:ankyrin repeat protein